MPFHRSRPIGNADTSRHRILASRSTIRQAESRDHPEPRPSAIPSVYKEEAVLPSTTAGPVSSRYPAKRLTKCGVGRFEPLPWSRMSTVVCGAISFSAATSGLTHLTLLQFFLNHRGFCGANAPSVWGDRPAEVLTGIAHPHWLTLLGFTRFQRGF